MDVILGIPKQKSSTFFSPTYLRFVENADMIYNPSKIRALREAKGWTKSKLAKEAGLSVPSIWALENGETRMPKHDTMLRIAAALGVSVGAISAASVSESTAQRQQSELNSIFEALSQDNRTALAAAAAALLSTQKRK